MTLAGGLDAATGDRVGPPESGTMMHEAAGREKLAHVLERASLVLGFLLTAYHMVMVFGVFQESLEHYTNHLSGALLITALTAVVAALGTQHRHWMFRILVPSALAVLLVVGVIASGYIRLGLDRLEMLMTFLEPIDMVIGSMLLAAILGFTWATWGAVVTIVVSLAILYFFLGQHLWGPIAHAGYDPTFVMSYLGMGLTAGLFKWVPLSADTIFLFMVFGSLVNRIHLHQLFTELGKAIGNAVRGGIAFPAVIGSALIGTVSGNSMGNIVLTGSMTIPLMKRFGYSPSSAAAIESVASSGGQIMPPIMGLGVFIMAAFLNTPYIDTAQRGAIPALLYFLGVGVAVFFLTRSAGIRHMHLEVDWRLVGRLSPTFVVSFGVLVWLLLHRYSENYAAFYALVTMIVLSQLQGRRRPAAKEIALGLAEGGIAGAQLAVLVVAAGALAQTVEMTNFAEIAYELMAGTLFAANTLVALVVTAIFVIVLGTGMPTAIAYVLGAITMAPLLQNLGIDRFAIHFFIFYFAVFANNTPPVALNVSTAARIADAPFWPTCYQTMLLSATAFFLPFAFVYNPSLLEFPRLSWRLVVPSIVTVLATFALAVAAFGYFRVFLDFWRRCLFGLAVIAGLAYVVRVEITWLAIFAVLLVVSIASVRPARIREAVLTPSSEGSRSDTGSV